MKHLPIGMCGPGIGMHHVSPGHSLMKVLGERECTVVNINDLSRLTEVLSELKEPAIIIIEDMEYRLREEENRVNYLINMEIGSYQKQPLQMHCIGGHSIDYLKLEDFKVRRISYLEDNPFQYEEEKTPEHNRQQVKCRGRGFTRPANNRKSIKASRRQAKQSKRKRK